MRCEQSSGRAELLLLLCCCCCCWPIVMRALDTHELGHSTRPVPTSWLATAHFARPAQLPLVGQGTHLKSTDWTHLLFARNFRPLSPIPKSASERLEARSLEPTYNSQLTARNS